MTLKIIKFVNAMRNSGRLSDIVAVSVVCVCVYMCACVRACVCLRPSTVKASSVWNSWDGQRTDKRCCVEDVGLLCRFP